MKKLLLVLLFLCIKFSYSQTYISPTGNNITGNGSVTLPYKTLFKATSVATSGVIHVKAGTYIETQTSSLKPSVSLEGEGVTSVIKSSITTNWVPILELLSPEGTNGNQTITNLKFDGQIVSFTGGTAWGIRIGGRKNVSIHHCTIVNFRNSGVIYSGRADNNNGAPSIYAIGNSFHDNILTNCAEYDQVGDYGSGCLQIGGQEGMLIYNNTITQDSRPCGRNGWCIKYNNDGYTKGVKIYNNVINKIPCCAPVGSNNWDFAIELFYNSGLEINNNQINGGSIDLNYQDKGTYLYSTWIHHNTITMPYINSIAIQSGILLEFQTNDCIVENNIIDKATIGISFTPRSGSNITNLIIRNNLIKNGGFGEGTGFHINFAGGSNHIYENIDVYNNTFVMDAIQKTWWGIALPSATSGRIKNINIKNNIIGNSLAGGIVLGGGSIPIENLHIQYNCIYNNGSNLLVNEGNSPTPSPGYLFTNNINNVPLFTGNFLLPLGSPLINAGVNVGYPYVGSAPDIGYSEFNGVLAITPDTSNYSINRIDEGIKILSTNQTSFIVRSNKSQIVTTQVFDLLGRLIYQKYDKLSKGNNLLFKNTYKGLYIIKVFNDSYSDIKKAID